MTNTPKLAIAIGYIDDDLVVGAVNYAPQKRNIKIDFSKWTSWAIVAACLCFIMIGAISFNHHFSLSTGSSGIRSISTSSVKEYGTAYTTEEIVQFITDSGESTVSKISEKMNIPAESISICCRGFYHVTITETENVLNLDYITLPIVANGKMIASVTLFREGENIKYDLNYGGSWGNKITELLIQHPNQQFAMIYIGDFVEAAISSDNTIYFLTGRINNLFESGIDYYSAFKFDQNTIDSSLLK